MTAPNRARTFQGQLRDSVTGELYAAKIQVTTAAPANLDAGLTAATFDGGAVDGTLDLHPLGREAAWDGHNRI